MYTGFKLVRQRLFHPDILHPDGGSGPFGDLAVDARTGNTWRKLDDVMQDIDMIRNDLTPSKEWFDLHCKLM